MPDWFPDGDGVPPKMGFLLDHPTSDEVLEQRPWTGKSGFVWEREYLKPFGLSINDVYIGHILRCQPKDREYGKPVYPTGGLKRAAELTCRQYDGKCWGGADLVPGGLLALDPNLFVITFHPSRVMETPALGRLIRQDVGRAVAKMKAGYRPLVLMGDEPRELVAPWTANKGGTKVWRGHFWAGEWPWKEGTALVVPGFLEV